MKLCAVTDEIAKGVEEAVKIGMDEKIRYFELRSVHGRRFPFYNQEDLDILARIRNANDIEYSAISPGIFKISIDQTPWNHLQQVGYTKLYRIAESLGCNMFIVFASKKYSDDAEYRIMIEEMRKFTYRASKRGMKVCLENSANTCCNSAEQLLRIVRDIGEKNLYINWDPGNAAVGNVLDVEKDYELLRPYILNMHIKDILPKEDGGKYFVPIGDGVVDYEKILSLLSRDGFPGCLTIETHCSNSEEAFRKSIRYLRKLLRQ